jgi:hypothetical protein
MTPVEFLRAVWPARHILPGDPRGNGAWRHWTYDTIDEAAAMISRRLDRRNLDVYFNIHTPAREAGPPQGPDKAAKGKTQVRVQTNMVEAKCFFFDLDVGPRRHKYATQPRRSPGSRTSSSDQAAGADGHVVRWRLSRLLAAHRSDLETAEWRDHATHLRQLAQHYGLKADPTRTTDTASSVLRVVGTFNWKDRSSRKPVDVALGGSHGTGRFC